MSNRRSMLPIILILLGICVLIGGIAGLLLYLLVRKEMPAEPQEPVIETIGQVMRNGREGIRYTILTFGKESAA